MSSARAAGGSLEALTECPLHLLESHDIGRSYVAPIHTRGRLAIRYGWSRPDAEGGVGFRLNTATTSPAKIAPRTAPRSTPKKAWSKT
jgi:hypothetical protein